MINGNLNEFVDTLYTGQDIEVLFHGRHYFIQGYYHDLDGGENSAHMEMFDYDRLGEDGMIWERDGKSVGALASDFLQARIWDGMSFEEAEPEIEWIG